MLEIYPWQNAEWQRLVEMQKHQRLPHALLLSGPEGIGLIEFARAFVMQVLCLNITKDEQACGTCQSCQLYLAGNHPDLLMLEPEETGKQIKIAQIRELIDYVELKSFSGYTKICIICPADAMNRATANALLKTLEEPPAQSKLILISHQPAKLSITVRSRCQRINFKPAYDEKTRDWLSTHLRENKHDADLLLRLSDGAPLKALSLLEDNFIEQRQTILKNLASIRKSRADVIKIAADWQEVGYTKVLSCLLYIIRDLIQLKLLSDKAKLINIDLQKELQHLVQELDLTGLIKNYDFVQQKYQETTSPMNYNPLSILEEVIIHWNSREA